MAARPDAMRLRPLGAFPGAPAPASFGKQGKESVGASAGSLTARRQINTRAAMTNASRPPRIAGLSRISADYRALLCDVWGVIHNGIAHFPAAATALKNFRAGGGHVLLVSNAPRPNAVVVDQLDRFGVPREAYDGVLTSGDVAREFLAARPGLKVLPIGPERDNPIYDGLPIELVREDDAGFVACTGLLDDDTETPDDYAAQLRRLAERRLPMLCINPDIVVERGDRLLWCAGALAERYAALGGEVVMVGKPHAPIYRTALARLSALRRPKPRCRRCPCGRRRDRDRRARRGRAGDRRAVRQRWHPRGGIRCARERRMKTGSPRSSTSPVLARGPSSPTSYGSLPCGLTGRASAFSLALAFCPRSQPWSRPPAEPCPRPSPLLACRPN